MSTYRIIARTNAAGGVLFKLQQKRLWWWNDVKASGINTEIRWFNSLKEAEAWVVGKNPFADRVVGEITIV